MTHGDFVCAKPIDKEIYYTVEHIKNTRISQSCWNGVFKSNLYSASCETTSYLGPLSWWRHQMEIFSALLAICAGNSPVPCEFPAQRPVTRSFDIFFDLLLNKRLRKQSWGWWFETLSRPLWRHCNARCAFFWGCTVFDTRWQRCCASSQITTTTKYDKVDYMASLRFNDIIRSNTETLQDIIRKYLISAFESPPSLHFLGDQYSLGVGETATQFWIDGIGTVTGV